ncbi:hypothetical protein CK203_047730 [Vitis vinifera]|uniref:Uncharacterized protein n=1 Tax=Vitis vinifera TaxID=29760 RepID=A0A438H174_VITVI|nr:hypothetical protein CK203_047730 [Vitis vinifera]
MAHTKLGTTPKREKLLILVTADEKEEFDLKSLPRVKAMVDSGVTHNFVATREVAKLGLKLKDDTSQIKYRLLPKGQGGLDLLSWWPNGVGRKSALLCASFECEKW